MLRVVLVAALVALAAADKVYQCKSTYQESNVPACAGYDWPTDYQMMCSKDDLTMGAESAYFTVADAVVPMCFTWVLKYEANNLEPNQREKRRSMFLWRGPNLQQKRKTCQDACKDVRNYIDGLGNEYKTAYFSCSYMENGNNQSVESKMLTITGPISGNDCATDTAYDKPTGDQRPPQAPEVEKPPTVPQPDPIDPDWSSAIMIAQIVLIVVALVLVLAGAIILFLFKNAMPDSE